LNVIVIFDFFLSLSASTRIFYVEKPEQHGRWWIKRTSVDPSIFSPKIGLLDLL